MCKIYPSLASTWDFKLDLPGNISKITIKYMFSQKGKSKANGGFNTTHDKLISKHLRRMHILIARENVPLMSLTLVIEKGCKPMCWKLEFKSTGNCSQRKFREKLDNLRQLKII